MLPQTKSIKHMIQAPAQERTRTVSAFPPVFRRVVYLHRGRTPPWPFSASWLQNRISEPSCRLPRALRSHEPSCKTQKRPALPESRSTYCSRINIFSSFVVRLPPACRPHTNAKKENTHSKKLSDPKLRALCSHTITWSGEA